MNDSKTIRKKWRKNVVVKVLVVPQTTHVITWVCYVRFDCPDLGPLDIFLVV